MRVAVTPAVLAAVETEIGLERPQECGWRRGQGCHDDLMATEDLVIDQRVTLPGWELIESFTPSGGPGGQHANKASTRVELRFDVGRSSVLDHAQKNRVTARLGPTVRVVVDDERSQARNRTLARERLADMLRAALVPPRRRIATRPSRRSHERRLAHKREQSERKSGRRRPTLDD
jgi:ribosome-associated protein